MRKNSWLNIVIVIISFASFFTVSCAKKEMVQTEAIPTTQPEVSKAPDKSAEEAEQARRQQEDRLRAEAAAREAAEKAFVNENIHFTF
jgi:hypothetical protein